MNRTLTFDIGIAKVAALGGFAGGVAEMIWVAFYGGLTRINPDAVARGITESLFPAATESSFGPSIGIAIHLLLSIVLAAAFAWALWRPVLLRFGAGATLGSAVLVLAGVWAVNFFAVLPILSPAFVTLLPYDASLVSKLLFGLVMGLTLRWSSVAVKVRQLHTRGARSIDTGTRAEIRVNENLQSRWCTNSVTVTRDGG